jgi:hypothetical protein
MRESGDHRNDLCQLKVNVDPNAPLEHSEHPLEAKSRSQPSKKVTDRCL